MTRGLVTVARYHLLTPGLYLVAPWAVLMFAFAVNLSLDGIRGTEPDPTKALVIIFMISCASGVFSISRELPFGLALGMSRRSYYLGTVGVVAVIAALDGLVIAGLQAIERATGGWGMRLEFFDVHFFLTGPWYLTWLMCFVGLVLLFAYGMWWGLIGRRWDTTGTLAFIATQVTLALAAVVVIGSGHGWRNVDHFFSAAGLTGALAGVVIVLLGGGWALMRRVTV